MKSSHYGYTYRPSNLQSKRDAEVVEPLTDADREYLTELRGISEMGNDQMLDAFQNAHYQRDQGYTEEHDREAARYDEYRAELLRRLLPKAGGEEAIDAIRDSGTCPYICFEDGEVCLDGYFTLDQLKRICAELIK